MKETLLKNVEIILPSEGIQKGSILIRDEKIADISSEDKNFQADEVFDLEGQKLYAGFIDIHIHGSVGIDVNAASVEDLHKVSKFLASKGITAWLPTLVPDSDENYQKIVNSIDELMEIQIDKPIAQALGVHYEGVFANEKMCGALRPQFFKTFKNSDEVVQLPKLNAPNAVHLMTLAPEIENGIELIKELKKQNWIVSLGHTKADSITLEKAKRAGAKHLTHFFNAMTGLHHRDLGVVGWGLTDKEISFDIIADGVHVHPKMLEFGCRSKTPAGTILISDAVAPTGLGDGDFEMWNEKISVVDGKTRNERGNIAGSVITMLDAVKMMLSLGFSETEVSQMASANPARLLQIEKTHGSIEIGKRADLIALDENGNAKLCFVGGKVCFKDI